ncbi:KR domain-containing protein [Usnea florida]
MISSILANAFKGAVSNESSVDRSMPQDTMLVQGLVGRPSSLGAYPDVIDWSRSKRLPAAMRPLKSYRLFHPDKTYFLVGLTGELGRSLCQWMVDSDARYIALGSRNADLVSVWLREMHALGASIKILKRYVSDRHSILWVHTAIKDAMPPVVGVCNAAMVLSDTLFADMNAETMDKVLKPKLERTNNLDELFNDPSLDFSITFYSLASVIGNGGQSNYHAANPFMTSEAAQRRNRDLAASVINVGMVADVGYVAKTGRSIEDHLRKLFYIPLSESDIHHLFAEAVLASPADSNRNFDIIMGIEPFLKSGDTKIRPPWFSDPRFSHCWK